MASSKEYLEYILEQLSLVDGISYRAMMGEYIIYYKGKVIAGIYDDRFLIKPYESVKRLMPDADYEIPYPKGKPMLLIDRTDDREFLAELFRNAYNDIPSK